MASRQIVVVIKVDAGDSVATTNKVTQAMSANAVQQNRLTQLQAGLTSSFIKGNLAARAISVAYLALRDALKFAVSEAINFEFNMAKIATITDTTGSSLEKLEGAIRAVSAETKQSQNELAKAALEMGKIGLNASQIEESLPGVAKLSRALDEDLVTSGMAVVAVLNTYGLAADQADKITNQLAFTVKASALDIESFRTAFQYVGAVASQAGVSFEELQASMDVLSNSGVRASTIGTQLRRIILNLSNENSKAAAVLGGKTLADYNSFGDALDDLASKHLKASALQAVFGIQASSVAALLLDQRDKIKGLADETERFNGLNKMSADMNQTVKASIEGIASAWADVGIQISKTANGPLKTFLTLVEESLRGLKNFIGQNQSVADYMASDDGKKGIKKDFPWTGDSYLFHPGTSEVAESEGYKKWMIEKYKRDKYLESQKNDPVKIKSDVEENSLDTIIPKKEKLTALQKEELQYYSDLVAWMVKTGVLLDTNTEKLKTQSPILQAANKALRDLGVTTPIGGLDPRLNPDNPAAHKFKAPIFQPTLDPTMKELGGASGDAGGRNPFKEWYKDAEKAAEKQAEFTLQMQLSLAVAHEFEAGITSIGGAFGEQLVESLLQGENAFKNFDKMFANLAKSIAAQITAMIVKFLVFKAALSILGMATGSTGFNFVGGGTGSNLILQALGGNNITKKATGGETYVNQPTLFMAGEAGPERVQVTPRGKLNKGGSGGGITVIIQGDVLDGQKFQEAVHMAEQKSSRRYV